MDNESQISGICTGAFSLLPALFIDGFQKQLILTLLAGGMGLITSILITLIKLFLSRRSRRDRDRDTLE